MGFLLHFARAMQIRARQNQAQFEMMRISNQQAAITNQLAAMEQVANAAGKENPGIAAMQASKQMLTTLSNALDLRLKQLQTRVQALSAEEQALDKILPDIVAKSAPKYCG